MGNKNSRRIEQIRESNKVEFGDAERALRFAKREQRLSNLARAHVFCREAIIKLKQLLLASLQNDVKLVKDLLAEAYVLHGTILESLEEWDEASECYQAAISLGRKDAVSKIEALEKTRKEKQEAKEKEKKSLLEVPSSPVLPMPGPTPKSNPLVGIPHLVPAKMQVKQLISEAGSFSKVHLGEYDGRKVVIKFPKTKSIQDMGLDVSETFEWEVRRLYSMQHPRVVQCMGAYIAESGTDKTLTIVSEYCGQGTLEQRLEKPIDWALVWQLVLDIVQGIAYIHSQGLVHRDLKTDNIYLDDTGRIKIGDFGAADADTVLVEKSATVARAKYHRWGAPEEYQGTSTQASDIYSFGLILHKIVTQQFTKEKKPYSGEDEYDLEDLLVDRGHSVAENFLATLIANLPKECPEPFKEMIRDCLQLNPEKRPTAVALIKRLREMQLCTKGDLIVACQMQEELIAGYKPPLENTLKLYVTEYTTIDPILYWERLEPRVEEGKEHEETKGLKEHEEFKETQEKRKIQDLHQTLESIWERFLNGQERVLLLLGDAGLGKSYSVSQWVESLLNQYRQKLSSGTSENTPIPILIRPFIKPWSTTALDNGIQKCLEACGLDAREVRNYPFVFVIDGMDECQQDKPVENLPQTLGLYHYTKAQLVVTCRRFTIPSELESQFFGLNHRYVRYYLLPLNLEQLLEVLSARLSLSPEQRGRYKKLLQENEALKNALRNPFVLKLFILGAETLLKRDLSSLSRSDIYAGFIEHWLMKYSYLLDIPLQDYLKADADNLVESFCRFAELSSFEAYSQGKYELTLDGKTVLDTPWINLEKSVSAFSEARFKGVRESSMDSRALLSSVQYEQLLQLKRILFESFSPVKLRSQKLSYMHKSFFEYFVAQHMVQGLDVIRSKEIVSEASRGVGEPNKIIQFTKVITKFFEGPSIRQEAGILDFIIEKLLLQQLTLQKRLKRLFDIVLLSQIRTEIVIKNSSSNAITIINRTGTHFSNLPLHHIDIGAADISYGVFDATNFQKAILSSVTANGVWLRKADFRQTTLKEVQWGERSGLRLPLPSNARSPLFEFTACCYDSANKWIAMGDYENVTIFEVTTRKIVQILEGLPRLSPLEKRSIKRGDMGLFGLVGHGLRKMRNNFYFQSTCVAFDKTGLIASGYDNGMVFIWSAKNGKLFRTLQIQKHDEESDTSLKSRLNWDDAMVRAYRKNVYDQSCDEDGITCIAFDNEGSIAVGHKNCTVRLWNVENGKLLGSLRRKGKKINCIAFDRKESIAVGIDSIVILFDTKKLEALHVLNEHTKEVTCIAIDNHEILVSGSRDKTVRIWDLRSGNVLRTLQENDDEVTCVTINEGIIAAGSKNGIVHLWELSTGKFIESFIKSSQNELGKCLISIAFDDDILISIYRDTMVRFQKIKKLKFQQNLRERINSSEKLISIAFDKKAILATGNAKGVVQLFDIKNGNSIGTFLAQSGYLAFNGNFESSESTLASIDLDTGIIDLWDTISCKLIRRVLCRTDSEYNNLIRNFVNPGWNFRHDGSGICAHIAYDNKEIRVIVKNKIKEQSEDYNVSIWKDNACLHYINHKIIFITMVCFNNEGIIAIGGYGGIELWEAVSGKLIRTLKRDDLKHDFSTINSIDFNKDIIVAAGSDGAVLFWNIRTGINIATLHIGTIVSSAIFCQTDENLLLVTISDHSCLRIWNVEKISEDNYEFTLQWFKNQSTLQVAETCIDGVIGMDDHARALFRDAWSVGEPVKEETKLKLEDKELKEKAERQETFIPQYKLQGTKLTPIKETLPTKEPVKDCNSVSIVGKKDAKKVINIPVQRFI